jgi:dTDP-4-amino-4,6-dideoxygalactose transaminase
MSMTKILIPFINLADAFKNDSGEIHSMLDEIGNKGHFILGDNVEKFETEFSNFIGTAHSIGVANGSDGLFLIMKALGIGPGDEVITQPNSFIASAWTIVALGAKPVFCDVDKTLGMDPDKLREAITDKTKAVMPVHLTGNPVDLDGIKSVIEGTSIHLIEDAAQAVGAKYHGVNVGNFGIAAMFSLHPLKNLGVLGDGGVITTNNSELDSSIRKLRNHGLIDRDHCEVWGYNSRLDEFQAGIGRIRLRKLEKNTDRVRKIAEMYTMELASFVKIPITYPNVKHVYHNYVIHTPKRNELQHFLLELGIETKVHYPIPIHLQECSKSLGYGEGSFPNTEYQSTNSLSLPIYPELSDFQVKSVISAVTDFFRTGP